MKEQLKILAELQVLEQQKAALLAQKAKTSAEEVRRLWQEIRLLSQSVVADREKLVCLEKVCTRQEADLSAMSQQCQLLESKLYSGEIKNTKEMEQIKHKCDSARKEIAELEDEAFANIELCEGLKAKLTAQEADLAAKKRSHAEQQKVIAQTLASFDNRLAELDSQYNKLQAQVQPQILSRYRELARKMTMPVARIEDGICSGCRRSLPTSQTALSSATLSHCDNCGRILLVE